MTTWQRMRIGLVLGTLAAALHWSYAHPHDRLHPELDGWFKSLQTKGKVPCCDGSDAKRLENVDWDSKDGHYRVRIEGEWVDVPDEAVIEEPNLAERALVWPYFKDGHPKARCFLPGSMT